MSDFDARLPARPSFEQLRKQATERLRDLRLTDPSAKLAVAQFGLAREYGFANWAAMKHYLATPEPALAEQYELLAQDLLAGCAGDAAALTRLQHIYGGASIAAGKLCEQIGRRLDAIGASGLTLENVRWLIARQHGIGTWSQLIAHSRATPQPYYRIDSKEDIIAPGPVLSARTWDVIFAVMQERGITGLDAGGRMTDAAMKRLAKLPHVTRLRLGGSVQLTDAGLASLAGMPQLRELHIDGWKGQITDKGLAVLRHLRELRRFELCWQQNVSDAGVSHLNACQHLEEVNLMGTPTGDEAVASLAGKIHLRQLNTGTGFTDAGIEHLHHIPAFKTWKGGEIRYGLMGAGAWPTRVMIDGPFTDAGLAKLAGLDGLFGLGIFWHSDSFTSAGLAVLHDLPRLGAVNCGESRCDDEAMRLIGSLPNLKCLIAQGAVAGELGFKGLSKSRTLEYLWGRDFAGLTSKGLRALSAISTLRGLAVNLANVDDLAVLPEFPALTELTPMNVPDAGFRHVGACSELEHLWCMYCRDTGDAATEHLAKLKLKTYYAGASQITDQSLQVLGRMASLERIEFWQCLRITDFGVAQLAGLPELRQLTLEGLPGVTLEVLAKFNHDVKVVYS